MKTCCKCKENKLLSLFGKDLSRKDGKHLVCKPCQNKIRLSKRKPNARIYNKESLIGQTFFRLTVLSEFKKNWKTFCICKCSCEKSETITIIRSSLLNKNTQSCGCWNKEKRSNPIEKIYLVGKQVNKLFIKKQFRLIKDENIIPAIWYDVLCNCGTEFSILKRALTQKKSQQGCQKCKVASTLKYKIEVSQGLTKLNSIDKVFNQIYYSYKHGAKRRQYSFNLTKEQFLDLIMKDCVYCNSKPCRGQKKLVNKKHNLYEQLIRNGIDRVDNSIGYEIDNCVPCCALCNWAKKASTKQDFLSWIEQVYNHSIKPKNIL